MSLVPIKGDTGGDNWRHPLWLELPFRTPHVGGSLESPQLRLGHPEGAGFGGEAGGDLEENRPKQGVVARKDATSLSLIAELSSPPGESRENGYFWKCFPSL